jgi:hypothetical protein
MAFGVARNCAMQRWSVRLATMGVARMEFFRMRELMVCIYIWWRATVGCCRGHGRSPVPWRVLLVLRLPRPAGPHDSPGARRCVTVWNGLLQFLPQRNVRFLILSALSWSGGHVDRAPTFARLTAAPPHGSWS